MAQALSERVERCRLVGVEPEHVQVAKFRRRRPVSELSDERPAAERAERESGLEEPGSRRGAPLNEE